MFALWQDKLPWVAVGAVQAHAKVPVAAHVEQGVMQHVIKDAIHQVVKSL